MKINKQIAKHTLTTTTTNCMQTISHKLQTNKNIVIIKLWILSNRTKKTPTKLLLLFAVFCLFGRVLLGFFIESRAGFTRNNNEKRKKNELRKQERSMSWEEAAEVEIYFRFLLRFIKKEIWNVSIEWLKKIHQIFGLLIEIKKNKK